MEDTIKVVIDFKNIPPKYPYITNSRDNYLSDMSYRSHMNYFKSKNGNSAVDTLLEDMVGGFFESAFNAINIVLIKKRIEKGTEKAVRKAVEDSGGKWTDN